MPLHFLNKNSDTLKIKNIKPSLHCGGFILHLDVVCSSRRFFKNSFDPLNTVPTVTAIKAKHTDQRNDLEILYHAVGIL